MTEEVRAFEPGSRFAFRVTEANVPALRSMVEAVTLEPEGTGTTMELAADQRPEGPGPRLYLGRVAGRYDTGGAPG